ncbi:YxiG family protein [Bacillus halotolerans]|uniref:YxiG family protein n=1 Tax=Bacillus halotolerans TaxID=260554 RepID=UPI0037FDA510
MTMYKTINDWVDYIDEGCSVLHLDFNVFKKELSLNIKVFEGEGEYTHKISFRNVASTYYNAGVGDMRLEKIVPEEYNWQIFEFSYHPEGIGNMSNSNIEHYHSNANFLINMNSMLIAIEAETVRFDDRSFYAYHSNHK